MVRRLVQALREAGAVPGPMPIMGTDILSLPSWAPVHSGADDDSAVGPDAEA